MNVAVASIAGPLESFLGRKPLEDFPRGAILYGHGADHLWLILRGAVREYRRTPKRNVAITVAGPGGWVGAEGLAIGVDRANVAEALTCISTMRWTSDEVTWACRTQAGMQALMAVVADHNADLVDRLIEKQYSAEARMAMVLLRLNRSIGTPCLDPMDGPRQLPPLTHQVLAEEVGTSREIVTSLLGNLRRAGALRYNRKDGIVIWPDRLRNEAAHE